MSADATALPERVGRYDIVIALRTDDRGRAYLARASGLGGFDRYVVLEIAAKAFQEREGFAKVAIDEATRVANLRHTNVVPVYDVGEDGAGVFLVTEYVPGASLADLPNAPKDVALRILVDALNGLHAAHEHADDEGRSFNVVHGDLAPSSIVVGTDGIARIADLPIARATRRAAKPLGDRFASPERMRGDELDRRADVWSGGVLAWEILTGTTFAAADAGDAPRVKSVDGAGSVADELDIAVANALKSDRDARTATCGAFAKELATAARAAGMFAEVERVAEHVKTTAGPELAKRREKILAPAKETTPTMIGVAAAKPDEPVLPDVPDVPAAPLAVKDTPLSVLGLKVDLTALVGDRANTAVLGAVTAPDDADKDEAKDEDADKGEDDADEIYESPVAVEPSTGTSNARSVLGGPLAKHEKIALAIGGGLLVVAVGIGIARCASGPANGPTAAGSASASASGDPSAHAASSSPSTPRAGALHITANGTIAKVAVGDRNVEVIPASSAEIELTPAERGKTLKVFVTSSDGRTAMATADPGVRGLDVVFGDRDTLPPPPPPSGAGATSNAPVATHAVPAAGGGAPKRTWPKRGPRK